MTALARRSTMSLQPMTPQPTDPTCSDGTGVPQRFDLGKHLVHRRHDVVHVPLI
jgi:hypothetical protein